MRRRRKPKRSKCLTVFGALLFLYVVSKPDLLLSSILLGVLILAITIIRRRRLEKSTLQKSHSFIEAHLNNLARRRVQLVRVDAYGAPILEKWFEEINYFLDRHLLGALSPQQVRIIQKNRSHWVHFIENRVVLCSTEQPLFRSFNEKMTSFDFELFCAEQLRLSGWAAEVTTQSRDQGVDIIAEKDGKRVVMQCKLYSGPVGNSAVQEISAGRSHERAHYGVVVTNSRYTAPAQQLAASNSVLLLHHGDLAKLHEMLPRKAA